MEKIIEKLKDYVPYVAATIVMLAVGILLTLLICHIIRKALSKSRLDPSLVAFLVRVIQVVCFTLVAMASLSRLGVSTTGLVAFFSAALAAVALALKDNISDLASGIIILFTRPFVTGDYIVFGNYQGFVQKIDLIQTRLKTYEGTDVIIPNSKVTGNEINNYTSRPEMRVKVNVPVSYLSDIDKTKKVLLEAVKTAPDILRDDEHSPAVRLDKFGESSLDFFILCWCSFDKYWDTYFYLTEAIKKALDENGIQIPFNQLDLHIIDDKTKQS